MKHVLRNSPAEMLGDEPTLSYPDRLVFQINIPDLVTKDSEIIHNQKVI